MSDTISCKACGASIPGTKYVCPKCGKHCR